MPFYQQLTTDFNEIGSRFKGTEGQLFSINNAHFICKNLHNSLRILMNFV